MKKKIVLVVKFILIFFISFIILDIILSLFLEKEFYKKLGKGGENIEKPGDLTELFDEMYPDSEFEILLSQKNKHTGSLFWLPKEKRWGGYGSGECSIYGVGDSITYGMGVESGQEYLASLSKLYNNTKVYNYGVNGHGIYQEILMNKKYINNKKKDLLIWQFFGDDFKMFKYIFGRIYNTSLNIDYIDGLPTISKYLGNDINNFLLKNSYIYNKILLIKLKNSKKDLEIKNEKLLLNMLDNFLKYKTEKKEKILFVFGLDYKIDVEENKRELRDDYKKIIKLLDKYNIDYINLVNYVSKDMFQWDNIHFTYNGGKKVAKLIFAKIKEKKLLNNYCY